MTIERNQATGEIEMAKQFKVTCLDDLGCGNPDAKIGFRQITEHHNMPKEVVRDAREVIKSGECILKLTILMIAVWIAD